VTGFRDLPAAAAWQHEQARTGFEVLFFQTLGSGQRLEGTTAAVEDAAPWTVSYRIDTDEAGVTRSVRVTGTSAIVSTEVRLDHDGQGSWLRDGRPAPELRGCLDVDLESSAMTNALPVRRLRLAVGAQVSAEAAYVRAADLTVERLEQTYGRIADEGPLQRYDYAAPRFDFTCVLRYDEHGLVTTYPGIAVRIG
jgi:uncharacterized protein